MTDPMDALRGLQVALDAGTVQLGLCQLHRDIQVLLDHPGGTPRFTYALVVDGTVEAVSLFALIDPYEDLHCFQVGYAVLEKQRGKGVGRRIVQQSIDELRKGLSRTPMKEFYLEAIVAMDNKPSNAIARKLISDTPIACTDVYSKEPALQYLRKVTNNG